HPSIGRGDVHRLRVRCSGGRGGLAGWHDRRHRTDLAQAQRRQAYQLFRSDPGPRERPHAPGQHSFANGGTRRACLDRLGPRGKIMTLTLAHYLILGAILFAIGIFGFFLNRRNLIILLMSIELMLLSANMNFVAFSSWFGDTAGQVFVFFILTVAAAEAAIGLAILVLLFRNLNTINVDDLDQLKG